MSGPAPSPLCKDCANWSDQPPYFYCLHPTSLYTPHPSYVDGIQGAAWRLLCDTARATPIDPYCGPTGRFFQAATP